MVFRWIALNLAATAVFAAPPDFLSADDAYHATSNAGWNLTSFSNQHLTSLVQKMASATYNVGFRYLGIEEDWFHGHVLYESVGEGAGRKFTPARDPVPHAGERPRTPVGKGT